MPESAPPPSFWLPPAYDAAAEAAKLAEQVRQTVALARGLASAGRSVDLAGLEQGVGVLCAKALDLAAEQGRAFRLTLMDLLNELDSLSAAMRTGVP